MLPHRISKMLIIFDAFGFSSGSTKLSNRRFSIAFSRLLNIALISFLTIFKYQYVIQFLSIFETIDMLNEIFSLSIPLYSWWLVIIDTYLQQHSHKKFWTIVEHINEWYCNQSKYNHRPYMLKFMEFFLITSSYALIMLASSVLHMSDENEDVFIAIVYVVLIKMLHMRLFYYLFCLDLVNFQLEMIDCEIKTIKICDFSQASFLSSKFKQLCEYSYCTFELVNHLNVVFGWSQVIAIPSCFYLLLTDLNWMFSFFSTISNTTFIGNQCKSQKFRHI